MNEDIRVDSLNGILEIDNVEPFLAPLKESMFNIEYIDRTLMLGGAILLAILLLWMIDKVMTWAVNSTNITEKKTKSAPIYLFPMFFFGAFTIDYITVIFGKFSYPWLSFSVLLVKGTLFLSTSLWAMRMFDVPVAKIFAFLSSVVKVWRNKDVDGLDKSIEDLSHTESKPNIGKKTTIVIILFVLISCLAPRRVAQPNYKNQVEIKLDCAKVVPEKVYRSAFDAEHLIRKAEGAKSVRERARARARARVQEKTVAEEAALEETAREETKAKEIPKKNPIPVYYKGEMVGKFKIR